MQPPIVSSAETLNDLVRALSQSTRAYAAVAVGGALGAWVRTVLTTSLPNPVGQFPWTLVGVNALGCALLALVLVWGERSLTRHSKWHGWWRPFLATGVLGGFTTTSAFAMASVYLVAESGVVEAIKFILISIGAGLLAFSVFHTLARKWSPRSAEASA